MNTTKLTNEEHDDLERILENEERTQDEDIDAGIMDDFSPMIKLFFQKNDQSNKSENKDY